MLEKIRKQVVAEDKKSLTGELPWPGGTGVQGPGVYSSHCAANERHHDPENTRRQHQESYGNVLLPCGSYPLTWRSASPRCSLQHDGAGGHLCFFHPGVLLVLVLCILVSLQAGGGVLVEHSEQPRTGLPASPAIITRYFTSEWRSSPMAYIAGQLC